MINYLISSACGRTITDRCILRLEECETCLAPSGTAGGVADMTADIAGKTTTCRVIGPTSPRTVCDSAAAATTVGFQRYGKKFVLEDLQTNCRSRYSTAGMFNLARGPSLCHCNDCSSASAGYSNI